MFSWLTHPLPKSRTAHQNPVTTEDNTNKITFHTNDPTAEYGMHCIIKPGKTVHVPPYHWHQYQTENFLVHSGTMRATLEGKDHLFTAGQTLTIKQGLYHTFENNSDAEPLVVSIGLDHLERKRDEAFFRNLYSYLDDCRMAKRAPQLPQLCLFLYFFDCYLALPGPKVLMKPLRQVLVFVIGVVVGKWLLGFKETYPEYYKEASK